MAKVELQLITGAARVGQSRMPVPIASHNGNDPVQLDTSATADHTFSSAGVTAVEVFAQDGNIRFNIGAQGSANATAASKFLAIGERYTWGLPDDASGDWTVEVIAAS